MRPDVPGARLRTVEAFAALWPALTPDTEYLYYDGPVLYTLRSPRGDRFLVLLLDREATFELEMIVWCSPAQWALAEAGVVGVRDLFARAESGVVFTVRTTVVGGTPQLHFARHAPAALPEEWLAAPDATLRV